MWPRAATPATRNDSFTAAKAQFMPTAMTIVGAVLHQAKFQDWVNAEKINDQIHVFNLRADQLFNALLEKKIDPKRFTRPPTCCFPVCLPQNLRHPAAYA